MSVGVFDSGLGGLSVLREMRQVLPASRLVYVADSKYLPYGVKPPETIRERSHAIVGFLVNERHVAGVVVACNTATTHAVDRLRQEFATLPIVGMEPAIKPAARATRSGVVGILATDATLSGERVASLIERNADGIEVLTQPCPGLVERVEQGDLAGPDTIELLEKYTKPLLQRGADTIVLGCTHYNFLAASIRQVVGPSVTLLDSAAAVARQAARVLADRTESGTGETSGGEAVEFFTSGDPDAMRSRLVQLWAEPVSKVTALPV